MLSRVIAKNIGDVFLRHSVVVVVVVVVVEFFNKTLSNAKQTMKM